MLKTIHRLARTTRSSSRDVRRFCVGVAVVVFGWSGVERAQGLTYVDHLSMPAHDTMLSTNIALWDDPFRDAEGNLVPMDPGTVGVANIFSNKALFYFDYDSVRIGGFFWPEGSNYPLGVSLTTGSEVSYSAKTYVNSGPNVSDNWVLQKALMTGSRNSLFVYNLQQYGWGGATLRTESSEPPFTPGNALLAAGDKTFLTTNGGIYYLNNDRFEAGIGEIQPFLTAQGSGAGELNNPSALNLGPDGKLYVLDAGNNRIQKFDITTGLYSGGFDLPEGMEVYSEIMVMEDWIPNPDNPGRVERRLVLDAEGKPIYLNNGGNVFSTSMAISHEGHIYLGDGLGGGFVFDLEGNLLSTFHPPEDSSWEDGELRPDFLGNPTVGAASFLMYDGYGNVFTYVEGKGINMYRDETYPIMPYTFWRIEGSVTQTSTEAIVRHMIFELGVSTATIPDTILMQDGGMYVAHTGSGVVEGGTVETNGLLHKEGLGTLKLNNALTVPENTLVRQGTLIINGRLEGDVVVAEVPEAYGNSVLGGTGTIGGSVTMENSSFLAPGDALGLVFIDGRLSVNELNSGYGTSLIILPGSATGLLTIEGDLTMAELSTLVMEIGGVGLSDQLTVEGTFTANGTLNIVLLDGYVPTISDTFRLFTEGGFVGAFTNITTNLGDNDSGLWWDTSRLASEGLVMVVPEPSTWALIALGLGGAFVFRKRRGLALSR